MKITAIKAQIKNPERVSIYIDDAYSFSLTHSQLLEVKLFSGLEVDEARVEMLKKISDFGKAYERILNFITIRPRSFKEVRDYCWRKHINQEDCEAICQKLSKFGYLDDASFAKRWVESRRLTKATSKRKLQLELRQKGVSDEHIAQAFTESAYEERAALRDMITKKSRLARYQDRKKLLQYLLRQGFSYGEIIEELESH